ncbi:ABC-F family ATP-binding cassette domain-containing protein [Aureibacillus halotolerans]|uniref:ATPase subunit of ABC transporter with duplicated ATPase domains n=1 Tax=Aureibacillus halotolerans TaxID=1508390 RepID=A0A4R6TYD1_9BACI|nr:ATP-binding cassette domain-containing protein [Aureibacillus halotolerans]TDQ37403.1 ATPase subunit of ABC transporter with duplicated ATPase domains [Aureibacillus halotolerans]
MLTVDNVSLRFGDKKLFEDVNIKFIPGNCYGLIGANGAGKSTFLNILSGELDSQSGHVSMGPGERLAVLKQDHFAYEEEIVLNVVIMGHQRLYQIIEEKNAIYMKGEFSDEDGMKIAELEGEFAELNGWEAESEAARLLEGLGIKDALHQLKMSELTGGEKVKVLLAQALFGEPDVLLLDEPTNHLDIAAIQWLEEFLINFENTVIVVSHDRYFLNHVCTHIADLDFSKIKLYVGNYDFWYESSQLAMKLTSEANKKKEEKIKELQTFIERFSANASKSKQATSRKKLLDKISLDDIQPSSRRYPYVHFEQEREVGNDLLRVEGISKSIEGKKILDNISFTMNKDDKIALIGANEVAKTTLFQILAGELEPDSGSYRWGVTTAQSYFPKDNAAYFQRDDINLVDWLRQYSPNEQDESFIRGFLGRMLFAKDEALKKVNVLSGGEKVRCMLSRMMLSKANVLLLDEPTNHLDLESITALNNGLTNFKGSMILSTHDHQLIQTVANRMMNIKEDGTLFDKSITYDEYLAEAK